MDVLLDLRRVGFMSIDEWPAVHPVQPPLEWALHAIGVARGELRLPPEHPLGVELLQGHGSRLARVELVLNGAAVSGVSRPSNGKKSSPQGTQRNRCKSF